MPFLKFKPSIRDRVLSAIYDKLDSIEREYEADLEKLEQEHELAKTRLVDKHVDSILKKIL